MNSPLKDVKNTDHYSLTTHFIAKSCPEYILSCKMILYARSMFTLLFDNITIF
ncbi:hypothetical protein NMT12_40097 [metagenome]